MIRQFDDAMKALHRAEDAIGHAREIFKLGILIVTANRCYYSAFYCMTALLHTQNVYAKTHQGTHTKFSELFIKAGLFPVSVSDDISTLFEYRQEADYDFDSSITEDEAQILIAKASGFLQLTKDYFNHLSADNKSTS